MVHDSPLVTMVLFVNRTPQAVVPQAANWRITELENTAEVVSCAVFVFSLFYL